MEQFEGILQIQLRNVGTRSEGCFPVLIREPQPSEVTDAAEAAEVAEPQAETLRLTREGAVYGDNSYFEPFDGLRVRIEGVMDHGWLVVERIVEAPAASGEAAACCHASDSDGEAQREASAGEAFPDRPSDKEQV